MAARVIDPELQNRLPRAPTEAEWAALSHQERARVVAALPSWMTDAEFLPPEGDPHREAKASALEALRRFFEHMKRRVYVGADLAVYYPGQPRFAPDVLAVLDVDPGPRDKWVVSAEGKGLDFTLEVLVSGSRRKDLESNVRFYADLGIPEYFVYDRSRQRLSGFRLPQLGARSYEAMVPQHGRFTSEVLGLHLVVEEGRLRFYAGNAPLLDLSELIARLEAYSESMARRAEDESKRAEDESKRAEDESKRAEDESKRADELARRVAELEAELRRR
jgi:Uma2 family endonuclease